MFLVSPRYRLLVAAAIVLLVVSFFTSRQTVDVHLLDTYYILDQASLFRATSFGLFLLWLLYEVNQRWLYSQKLIRVHVILTLLSLATVLGTVLWTNKLRSDRSFLTQEGMVEYHRWEQLLAFSLLILLAVQVVFILNIVLGLVKVFKRP